MKVVSAEPRPQAFDPVFLRATASGPGGIATLVIDGRGCISMLSPLLQARRSLHDLPAGEVLFARLLDDNQRVADEVLVTLLNPSGTSTGNPQVELSGHGGLGALAAVENALLAGGLRRGRETELLERAHLNAKLSLIGLEARIRLAAARTARQADFLLSHTVFQERWERFGFDMAMGLRTRDFSWREKIFAAAEQDCNASAGPIALLARHHVVIAGPVNAGKSTLANWLARSERHLVSEIPGTTLDRLDTPLALRGLDVLLSDTAGQRLTRDEIEKSGQERARQASASASLRLVALDGSRPPTDADLELLARSRADGEVLLVLNKSDLGMDESALGLGFLAGREPVVVSAHTGQGLDQLELTLEQLLLRSDPQAGQPFTRRHAALLRQLRDDLKSGVEGAEALLHVRNLIGTRPDPEQLTQVLEEGVV
jgi:tRNA modification GTPase